MEVVGLPAAQRLAFGLLRPGGTLASIGCHSEPRFAFSPGDAYDKNLIYRTGRCPARQLMPKLARELAQPAAGPRLVRDPSISAPRRRRGLRDLRRAAG